MLRWFVQGRLRGVRPGSSPSHSRRCSLYQISCTKHNFAIRDAVSVDVQLRLVVEALPKKLRVSHQDATAHCCRPVLPGNNCGGWVSPMPTIQPIMQLHWRPTNESEKHLFSGPEYFFLVVLRSPCILVSSRQNSNQAQGPSGPGCLQHCFIRTVSIHTYMKNYDCAW